MLGLGNSLSNIIVPAAAGGGSYENEWSVVFDGSNDYADLGSTFQSTFQDSFSLSFWMYKRVGSTQTSYQDQLFGMSKLETNYFVSDITDEGVMRFRWKSNGDEAEYKTGDYSLGTSGTAWFHIAWVFTKSGTGTTETTVKLYVNAVDTTITKPWYHGVTAANHGAFSMDVNMRFGGYYWSPPDTAYYGQIAGLHDIGIFSTALDSANITAIYNSGESINLSEDSGNYDQSDQLVSYYKLNEGTGTSIEDSAGSSDGTLTNGPTWLETKPS